jgi:hypothetical protein
MTAVGGFFELETCGCGRLYHADAVSLCSGRAALRLILEAAAPRRVLVPFYICDSLLVPFDALDVPYAFYQLSPSLEPLLPAPLSPDEGLVYVNYFGLKTEYARRLQATTRAGVIIDDTQAFFQRGYERTWSFNSARKFFGVPDGAYAYGTGLAARAPAARLEEIEYDHLVNRLLGRQALAYQQYVEHEQHVPAEVLGASRLAERLLAGIDYDRARQIRVRNFAVVHERLGRFNRLALDLESRGEAVPFCYPLLPETTIRRELLWQAEIFVPQLWPEVERRTGEAFAWERDLAGRLLPLPIDHRYDDADMNRMCDVVVEKLA